jgi:hypothetical protein
MKSASRSEVVDSYMDIFCSSVSHQVVQEAGPNTGRWYSSERGGKCTVS